MDEEDKVYKYLLSNINMLLQEGISYYEQKDINLKNKLIDFYDYINNDGNFEVVVEKDIHDSKEDVNETDDNVKKMASSFMDRLTNIKISLLNIDNDIDKSSKESSIKNDSDMKGMLEMESKQDSYIASDDELLLDENDGNKNSDIIASTDSGVGELKQVTVANDFQEQNNLKNEGSPLDIFFKSVNDNEKK